MFLEVVFLVAVLTVLLGILYARWNFGTLERMGYKVVEPHWFFGSNNNIINVHAHWEDVKRNEELGPIYGVYEGRLPILYVNDPDVIHRIMFTNADHFGKREHRFGAPLMDENIEFHNGEKWKALASLMSPQFTTGKIKGNVELISKVCARFEDCSLAKKADSKGRVEKVDLHEWIAPWAIQIIAEVICCIKINASDPFDPKNPFVTQMRKTMFEKPLYYDLMIKTLQSFPFLASWLNFLNDMNEDFFIKHVNEIVNAREQSGDIGQDMVAVLAEIKRKAKEDPEFKRLNIPEVSMHAQAFEFFAASFIGTVTTIKMLLYHLHCEENAEALSKVLEEIDSMGQVSYETLTSKLEYLGACISETLRISPAFYKLERVASKDWSYQDRDKGINMQLPKGTHLAFSLFALHHNEEYFPESKRFLPERFLGEPSFPKCAYFPFGLGTRQCMGQRFALLMIKSVLFHVLKGWRLERRADTKWEEEKGTAFGFMNLKPIYFDFVKRKV